MLAFNNKFGSKFWWGGNCFMWLVRQKKPLDDDEWVFCSIIPLKEQCMGVWALTKNTEAEGKGPVCPMCLVVFDGVGDSLQSLTGFWC